MARVPFCLPCRAHSRFTVRLPHRMRSARAWVAGKRVKVRGRPGHLRVRVNMRHHQRVTVKVRGRDRHGKLVRSKRVYERCR